ncbi:MAG: hypothetical protein AAFR23_10870 [Pseudomonadota bacterium]
MQRTVLGLDINRIAFVVRYPRKTFAARLVRANPKIKTVGIQFVFREDRQHALTQRNSKREDGDASAGFMLVPATLFPKAAYRSRGDLPQFENSD